MYRQIEVEGFCWTFADVNAFMSHLGKCNVPEPDPVSSSEGEDSGEVDENGQKIKYSKKDNKKDKSNKSTGKKFKCRICCDVLRYSSFKAHTRSLAPLAQFHCVALNSSICLEGKSLTLIWGNTNIFRSSQQLPRHRLGPLKGFF